VIWIAFALGVGCWSWYYLFVHSGPRPPARIVVACLGLGLALVGLAGSIQQLRHPDTLFEITELGIWAYRTGAKYIRQDIFIPWDRVVGMYDYSTYRKAHSIRTRTPRIDWGLVMVQIRTDYWWPPVGSVRPQPFGGRTDEIYLDSGIGWPRGPDLLQRMEAVRARYWQQRQAGPGGQSSNRTSNDDGEER
jgi:hypothetical protein